MTEISIVPIERLELAFVPRPWPFANERRAEIDAHFDAMRHSNPALWNGRVLMLHEHELRGPVFRGAYLETDFASLLAWRRWNFPDPWIKNCFAMGALLGSDGEDENEREYRDHTTDRFDGTASEPKVYHREKKDRQDAGLCDQASRRSVFDPAYRCADQSRRGVLGSHG